MRLSALLVTLVAAVATCLPTEVEVLVPEGVEIVNSLSGGLGGEPNPDGRGCTLYSYPNFDFSHGPDTHTTIPGSNTCTDLNNIFGNWDTKPVRSLQVEPSTTCRFYLEKYECQGRYFYVKSQKDTWAVVGNVPDKLQFKGVRCYRY